MDRIFQESDKMICEVRLLSFLKILYCFTGLLEKTLLMLSQMRQRVRLWKRRLGQMLTSLYPNFQTGIKHWLESAELSYRAVSVRELQLPEPCLKMRPY